MMYVQWKKVVKGHADVKVSTHGFVDFADKFGTNGISHEPTHARHRGARDARGGAAGGGGAMRKGLRRSVVAGFAKGMDGRATNAWPSTIQGRAGPAASIETEIVRSSGFRISTSIVSATGPCRGSGRTPRTVATFRRDFSRYARS